MIRHHRLLEQYLTQALGLSLDEVHAEADRLEHALSEELEAPHRPVARLPDARPARRSDSRMRPAASTASQLRTLASLEPGDEATIRRVPDDDDELLRYLTSSRSCPARR